MKKEKITSGGPRYPKITIFLTAENDKEKITKFALMEERKKEGFDFPVFDILELSIDKKGERGFITFCAYCD